MNFNLNKVKKYIEKSSLETKIYIGADSVRTKRKNKWFAIYTVAIVVHINGNSGCKVFGEITEELDFDQNKEKPFNRMMNEVYKASSMYLLLEKSIGDRYCEIHLDLNPNKVYGSNCAVQSAIGYVQGTCNLTPLIKPNGPAASTAADRLKELIS